MLQKFQGKIERNKKSKAEKAQSFSSMRRNTSFQSQVLEIAGGQTLRPAASQGYVGCAQGCGCAQGPPNMQ
jgi:hypothetical protein